MAEYRDRHEGRQMPSLIARDDTYKYNEISLSKHRSSNTKSRYLRNCINGLMGNKPEEGQQQAMTEEYFTQHFRPREEANMGFKEKVEMWLDDLLESNCLPLMIGDNVVQQSHAYPGVADDAATLTGSQASEEFAWRASTIQAMAEYRNEPECVRRPESVTSVRVKMLPSLPRAKLWLGGSKDFREKSRKRCGASSSDSNNNAYSSSNMGRHHFRSYQKK